MFFDLFIQHIEHHYYIVFEIKDVVVKLYKMANPWDSEPSFINHGGLNHILLTNKKICSDISSHPAQVNILWYLIDTDIIVISFENDSFRYHT